jgi:dihydroorotase
MEVPLDFSHTILNPSNFHAHLRRDALMRAIAKHIMQHVKYLLIMPNTGPIKTMEQAITYYDELMQIAETEGLDKLQIIMTLYHTSAITPQIVEEIAKSGIVRAIKHYPPELGLTTGSGQGMALEDSHEMLSAMEECGVPLLGHFELGHDRFNRRVDPLDGEATMVEEKLWQLRDRYPRLRICFEHVSTWKGLEWVKADTSGNTVATVTPHHSSFSEDDFDKFGADLKCKPVVQTKDNQEAVREFMVSGDERAIAGDDTAAHISRKKYVEFSEAANGCYFAEQSTPLYARAFMDVGAMDQRFENFMSLNGPKWWGLPAPEADDTITIYSSSDDMPDPVDVPEENDVVIPLGWSDNPTE